jgi:ketosteroid isomerase-like protein
MARREKRREVRKVKACPCSTMKRRVRRAYRAYRNGDVDGVLKDWADDARFFASGRSVVRWGGEHRGKPAIRRAFERMKAAADVLRWDPLFMFCVGETVIAAGSYTMRCRESGRPFSGCWIHAIRFDEGCKMDDITSLYDAEFIARNCRGARDYF